MSDIVESGNRTLRYVRDRIAARGQIEMTLQDLIREIERLRENIDGLDAMEEWVRRLRAAGFDIIQRIEAWEAAVRSVIGEREFAHGMDLTQLRAALHGDVDDAAS